MRKIVTTVTEHDGWTGDVVKTHAMNLAAGSQTACGRSTRREGSGPTATGTLFGTQRDFTAIYARRIVNCGECR